MHGGSRAFLYALLRIRFGYIQLPDNLLE